MIAARARAGRRADRAVHLRKSDCCGWVPTAFAAAAADAGVDGVLVARLPVEEAGPLRDAARRRRARSDIPAEPDDDRRRGSGDAAELGRGFLYVISRLGVTGVRDELADGVERWSRAIRRSRRCRSPSGSGSRVPSTSRRRARGGRGGGRQRAGAGDCRARRVAGRRRTGRRLRAMAEERSCERPTSTICAGGSTCSTSSWCAC